MYGARHRSMVPGRLQSLVELSYEFIADMVGSTVGKEGRKYFPFVFTLFMFVLFGNALGMIPGSFTYTSHIIVTFTLAIFVVTSVTIIGFVRHGLHFFSFFAPAGCPIYVMPLLVPIEILSYLIRPISLSVRLFVNMMAGHIMLKTFAGFIIALGSLRCRGRAAGADGRADRARARDRLSPGVRVHGAELHLSAGCDPSALIATCADPRTDG